MERKTVLILLVLLIHMNVLQGLEGKLAQDEKFSVKRRLELINKPFIQSYRTKFGDILDCVDINKQFAFDHPLLKNHTIQMKPNFKISKQTTLSSDHLTVLTPPKLVPKNRRCPRGTVPIRRIQEEDLALEKFSSKLGTTFSTVNSSKSINSNNHLAPGHQIATVAAKTRNFGVSGYITVWNPEVATDQLSDVSIFVASDGNGVTNAISAGWMVNPYISQDNKTRLFGYWTSDSGKTTGCFNQLCPGFVQISRKFVLGNILQPVSTYGGPLSTIQLTIEQDRIKKNWWLVYGAMGVGYWPGDLFNTLSKGAKQAGWGGEISSPPTEPTPAMGSGHFPQEGYKKACKISSLSLVGTTSFPADKVMVYMSKPDCYKVDYGKDGGDFDYHMYVGGPPNCHV